MVFICQQGWQEIKLGRVFAESACLKEKKRGSIRSSGYVAHLGNQEAFLAKFDPLVSTQKQLVVLAYGARWIWQYWNSYYPDVVQILD